jgi:serine/threonine-protein kinase
MATVYLAHDLRHDRSVALKVLHPELAAALGPERFQREIRLAARLQHPHILTVHDSGEAPGTPGAPPTLWFAMPFVEGESLRDRLTRQKQLPVEEALRIATETADALDYAHRHGVIHRDIKPENILLAEGHALVADFGISKALAKSGDQHLTETGMALGTPAYMSPEQAAGEKDLDARTDVYSLATVLYEMLAGETPFAAPTAQAMIARRFMETPRPIRQLRDSVPEGIEQAVQRGLARTAADRYATAAEFSRALAGAFTTTATVSTSTPTAARPAAAPPPAPKRRIPVAATSLGLGLLIGLGVLFAWRHGHGGETPGAGGAKLLAVLPFENLGSADDEYFADGVTDEVRGKLASLPSLQVTARSSSNQYKKTTKSPREIGRDLGVDYLLTGTVRWEKGAGGNHVRVSPELIQVSTGSTKWQEPFDASLTDVFTVQAEVAGQVAQALGVALGAGQKETLTEKPTQNLAAYDAFLKGEATQGLTLAAALPLRSAITYYEQAVALDSGFAQAWAQLARAHAAYYYAVTPSPSSAEAAKRAAERAMALAPGRPLSQLGLGDYYYNVNGENDRALALYDEGLKAAPDNADLLTAAALAEQSLGRWDAAVKHLELSRTLDPRSVTTARRLSGSLLRLRRYPEALAATDQGLTVSPDNLDLLENKVMVSLAQGDLAGAQAVIRGASPEVEPTALVAAFGNYWDLYWVLDDAQQQLLLRLPMSAYDGARSTWGIVTAQTYAFRGEQAKARVFADSARLGVEENLGATPNDAQLHVVLGLALAYLGRKAEAMKEGERAVALAPASRDGYLGPYIQHQLVRIYVLVGEPEKALEQLEPLLKIPYYLSPGWLKIDPTFDPLRKNPRFQKLVEGTA